MPVIVEKRDWKGWLEDPEEQDREWTFYKCPCGHQVMSDIAFPNLWCLKCGEKMPKDPETALRISWDKQGIPKEKQDEIVREVEEKAKPEYMEQFFKRERGEE